MICFGDKNNNYMVIMNTCLPWLSWLGQIQQVSRTIIYFDPLADKLLCQTKNPDNGSLWLSSLTATIFFLNRLNNFFLLPCFQVIVCSDIFPELLEKVVKLNELMKSQLSFESDRFTVSPYNLFLDYTKFQIWFILIYCN